MFDPSSSVLKNNNKKQQGYYYHDLWRNGASKFSALTLDYKITLAIQNINNDLFLINPNYSLRNHHALEA